MFYTLKIVILHYLYISFNSAIYYIIIIIYYHFSKYSFVSLLLKPGNLALGRWVNVN